MGRPRLSSFTIIGIVLLAIGIYGLIPGTRFTFDPGVPAEPHEALLYIIVGVLMVVNGFFWMKPLAPIVTKEAEPSNTGDNQEKAAVSPSTQAAKTGDR